jgi:hypothetical protein
MTLRSFTDGRMAHQVEAIDERRRPSMAADGEVKHIQTAINFYLPDVKRTLQRRYFRQLFGNTNSDLIFMSHVAWLY